jgi:hypothetical protein
MINPMPLKQYYLITGNECGIAEDFKLRDIRSENPICKSYDNIDDRYIDAMNKLEDICNNAPILETEKPYYEYAIKTPLKNMSIKDKSRILQKEYCKLLSVESEFDEVIDGKDDNVIMNVKRDKTKQFIRLEMGYFVWKMNDWRTKTNSSVSKKQLNSVLNQFRIVFNRTTTNRIMTIKTINGKKYISFNKQQVLDRINEKYVFSED